MPNPTDNFGWDKPEVGVDEGAWGDKLNTALDDIDEDLQAVKDTADAALASTGTVSQTGRLDTKTGTMARVALGSVSGATVLDVTDGQYFIATITGTTAFTFDNVPSGAFVFGLILRLVNAGAHTVSFPASVQWPEGAEPEFTASGTDMLVMLTDDDGTTWRAMVVGRDIR